MGKISSVCWKPVSYTHLYNKFKNMDLDEEQLREQVHKVYDKLESLGVTKEDVKSIFGKLVDMVKDILN